MATVQCTRTVADSPTKRCTKDGCDRPLRAKGLCGTHYNQQMPNRYKMHPVTCAWCGSQAMKYSARSRYAKTYCGSICRDHGLSARGDTSELPESHWGRWYGASMQIHYAECAECETLFASRYPTKKYCDDRCAHKVAPVPKFTRTCYWCGADFETHQSRARYCSKEHNHKHGKVRRRAREHNAQGDYTFSALVKLWAAFDKCCAYCQAPTDLQDIQAEHVTPLSRGGRNDLSNLLPSCGPCNADKRDVLLHEWNDDRARRGLAPLKTAWDDTDSRYRHLVVGMVSLAA